VLYLAAMLLASLRLFTNGFINAFNLRVRCHGLERRPALLAAAVCARCASPFRFWQIRLLRTRLRGAHCSAVSTHALVPLILQSGTARFFVTACVLYLLFVLFDFLLPTRDKNDFDFAYIPWLCAFIFEVRSR
jgi:hypothetical protein